MARKSCSANLSDPAVCDPLALGTESGPSTLVGVEGQPLRTVSRCSEEVTGAWERPRAP